ncbi:MAG: DMT family transporter [Chitinophagales bacterium]
MSKTHHNPENWVLLTLLTLIWGSSYILIKKGLIAFAPLELASLRISISCLVSLPFAIKALRTIPRDKYFTILQVGFFGSGAPAILFSIAMTKSDSGLNGILNSLSPLWTLVVGYYIFKINISAQKVWGVIIGFMGALVLVLGKKGGGIKVDTLYSILPVIATFCYGMSSNITKQKLQDQNPVYSTSLAMLMIGIPALIGLSFSGAPQKIMSGEAWVSLASVAFLAVVGTLIAWILFYRLVQRTDALFAASVTYLIPIVALYWGYRDGEELTAIQLGGMLLILLGVYFTTATVVWFGRKTN